MREQIEADKRARAEKAAKEKALREGQAVPESAPHTGAAAAASSSSSAPTAKKEYTETRLQVRELHQKWSVSWRRLTLVGWVDSASEWGDVHYCVACYGE